MFKKSERIRELLLAPDLFPGVLAQEKTCTVRTGHRNIHKGTFWLRSSDGTPVFQGEDRVRVRVTGVKRVTLGELTMNDLLAEGMNAKEYGYDLEAMLYAFWADMGRFYPGIDLESDVTVIYFKLPNA